MGRGAAGPRLKQSSNPRPRTLRNPPLRLKGYARRQPSISGASDALSLQCGVYLLRNATTPRSYTTSEIARTMSDKWL